ncbi:MAG: hypothetical protein K6E30_08095 [Lachnospiraceae bacterium]|nr:hypothetical protein [Lachnospiraceae bacterium]
MVKKRFLEASAVLEISLLMPLLLFALLSAVYLSMHVHNRTWLSAAAVWEAAGGGTEDTELLFSEPAGRVLEDSKKRRKVSFTSRTVFPFFEAEIWEISAEAAYEKVRPLVFIRNAKALKDA